MVEDRRILHSTLDTIHVGDGLGSSERDFVRQVDRVDSTLGRHFG